MVQTATKHIVSRPSQSKAKVSIFHCANAISDISLLTKNDFEVSEVKLPCSSIIRGLFLLRAFEAGADAVLVLVCPEGQCRHLDGNIRAFKRVEYIKKVLDDIGLGGKRLAIHGVQPQDTSSLADIKRQLLDVVSTLGPNPAAKHLRGYN